MSNDKADLWSKLFDLHEKAAAPTDQRAYALPEPEIGSCKVRLERLVWDDRVMAFVVRLIPIDDNATHWSTANTVAHITVGTASPSIKPVESNHLLAQWLSSGSGANGIMEMAVNGNVEIDGVVKAVLQKL